MRIFHYLSNRGFLRFVKQAVHVIIALSLLSTSVIPVNAASGSIDRLEFIEKVSSTAWDYAILQKHIAVLTPEIQTASGNVNLECIRLGDWTTNLNLCGPEIKPYISNSFSITNTTSIYQTPHQYIKVVCDGYGCTQLPVYYSLTCAVDWKATTDADISIHTNIISSTKTPIASTLVDCGAGREGECFVNLQGEVLGKDIPANPDLGDHLRAAISNEGTVPGNLRSNYFCNWAWSLYPISNILDRSTLSTNTPKTGQGDPRECAINGCSSTQGTAGDPINTRTGNFDYSLVDLSLQTVAGPLTYQRSYASLATDPITHPTELSPGWTHNQDTRLIFETGKVWFKGHTVNQYQFVDNGDQTYTPYPGVLASLTYDSGTSTYSFISSDQSFYQFDTAGALQSWRNEQGFGFDYTYSGGKLYLVTEPLSGHYLQFNYQNGHLSSVNDHTNRQVSFGYDASGDLTSFTDARGYTWSYTYTNHQLTTIKDPSNQTILTNAYDAQGRVYEQFNGKNERIVKITYNADGTSTILDALGRTSVDGYDGRGVNIYHTDPANYTVYKEYDENFRLSRVTNQDDESTIYTWSADGANLEDVIDAEGYNTHLIYDSQNHLVQTADPYNRLIDYTYVNGLLTALTRHTTGWGDIVTNYSYTTAGDPEQPPGLVKTVTDDLGNTTTLIYNSEGQLQTIQDAASTETVKNETWFMYDEYGNIQEITDPLGRVTRFEYDAAGNTRFVIQNYVPGQPQDEGNQYNLTTEYVYDAQGRMTDIKGKLNETTWITTSVVYDDAGRIFQTINANGKATTFQYLPTGQIQTIADPLTHTTTYVYDEAQKSGRLLQVQDALGRTVQKYSYNPDSTVAAVTTPTVHTAIDPTDYVISYSYDRLKRVLNSHDNSGHATTNTYDAYGNILTQTDALNRVTKYDYNELGLLKAVTQNYKNGVPPDYETNVLTTYDYNELGWLTRVTDANNHATQYVYDPLGRLKFVTDARLKVTEYGYDQNSNRTTLVDANGHTTTFQYDLANRLRSVDYPAGAAEDVRFWYDALSRVKFMDDSLGRTTWNYDQENRITSIIDPFSKTVNYGYDDAGNLTSLIYPGGRMLTYQYNAANQLEHVLEGDKHWADYVYDPGSGRLTSQTRANGVTSDFLFDYSGQLTSLIHQNASSELASYTYQYDAAGNRVQAQETLFYPNFNYLPAIMNGAGGTLGEGSTTPDAVTPEDAYPPPDPGDPYPYPPPEGASASFFEEVWTFLAGLFDGQITNASAKGELEIANFVLADYSLDTLPSSQTIDYVYDPLNRLREANYSTGSTYHYSYDATGNRTSQAIDGVTTAYLYDEANRLIEAGGVPFSWDDNGNLLSDGNLTYAYDYANRLISASNAESSYSFAYDGLGNRYQQTAGGQTTTFTLDLNASLPQVLSDGTNTYLYGLDRLAQESANGAEFFLPDGLGSARQLTNAYGGVTFGQAFDPFGSVIGAQGIDTTHYGFTGEQDSASGLLYLRARYYSPAQGRFISRDSFPGYLSQPSTLNAYAYALNNPATLTDPSGKISPIAIIAIAGFAAGVVYDAYQQTDGFTDFCQYDILQTLSAGVGGAAAASMTAIMLVSGVGMLGMGLQGVALGLYSIGISAGVSTSLFIAGTTTVSWAGMAMTWLFTQQAQSQISEIDKIKPILSDAATRAQQSVGEGSGHAYGTQVHTAFAKEVQALGRSDLIPEVSYQNGQPQVYGSIGSVRVDVVYGSKENPIAIFDLKTGTASLTVNRINQIRSHLPLPDVPIFEVNP